MIPVLSINFSQCNRLKINQWKLCFLENRFPSGLSHNISNSSKDRRLGPRLESPLGITISMVQNWKKIPVNFHFHFEACSLCSVQSFSSIVQLSNYQFDTVNLKNWLNLSLDSYKVKCKELFLKN